MGNITYKIIKVWDSLADVERSLGGRIHAERNTLSLGYNWGY